MGPEIGPADFSVWNSNIRQRLNTGYTAGFYAIGAWTKRKLLAAMFKTGARTVSHLYFNTSFAFQYCISVSHLSGLKASSHMRFLSRHLDATFTKIVVRLSFPVLSCQMFDKKYTNTKRCSPPKVTPPSRLILYACFISCWKRRSRGDFFRLDPTKLEENCDVRMEMRLCLELVFKSSSYMKTLFQVVKLPKIKSKGGENIWKTWLEWWAPKRDSNRVHSIYQYSNMVPRISGQTSIFSSVFFVS